MVPYIQYTSAMWKAKATCTEIGLYFEVDNILCPEVKTCKMNHICICIDSGVSTEQISN